MSTHTRLRKLPIKLASGRYRGNNIVLPLNNTVLPNKLPNNKVLMSFKIDRDLKSKLDAFGDEIGVTLSTMINALLRKVERTKQLDLSVEEYYTPKPATIKIMDEARAEYDAGKTISMTGVEFSAYLKKLSI